MGCQKSGNHFLNVGGSELQASFAALAVYKMPEVKCFRGCLIRIEARSKIFVRRAHELDPFWTIIVLAMDSAA
jgi:hypothetical protein